MRVLAGTPRVYARVRVCVCAHGHEGIGVLGSGYGGWEVWLSFWGLRVY